MRMPCRCHGFRHMAMVVILVVSTATLVGGNILLRLPSNGPPPTCDGDLQLYQLSARCTSRQCEEVQLFGSLSILQNITEKVQLSLSVSTTIDEEYLHVGTFRLNICDFLEARHYECPMVGNYRFNFTYPYFLAEYDKFEDGTWNVRLEISSYYDGQRQQQASSILSSCYMSLVLHKKIASMSLRKVFVFTCMEVALMIGSIIAGYFARKKCRVACLDELVCLVEDDEEELTETGALEKPPLPPPTTQPTSATSDFVPLQQQLDKGQRPRQQNATTQQHNQHQKEQFISKQRPTDGPQIRASKEQRHYASLFISPSGSTASIASSQQQSSRPIPATPLQGSGAASVSSSLQTGRPDSTPLLRTIESSEANLALRSQPLISTVGASSSSSSGIVFRTHRALHLGLPSYPDGGLVSRATAPAFSIQSTLRSATASPTSPIQLPPPTRQVQAFSPNFPPRRPSIDPPAQKNAVPTSSSSSLPRFPQNPNVRELQHQQYHSNSSIPTQDSPLSSTTQTLT